MLSLPEGGLKGNPEAVLKEMESFATNQRMMTFKLNKIEVARSFLEKLAQPPKVLIELGTYVGQSAVAWGWLLKSLNGVGPGNASGSGIKIYCLELDAECQKIASDMVKLAGLDDVVEVVLGQSSDSLKKLKEGGKIDKIDVLFVDHWEKYYKPDLQLCEDLGLFHEGSVVIADNTDMPGAPEYMEYVRAGGRGTDRTVKFKTETFYAKGLDDGRFKGPMAVEITTVVSVP